MHTYMVAVNSLDEYDHWWQGPNFDFVEEGRADHCVVHF